MRFGSTSAQRASPIDRNAIARMQNGFGTAVAPHGATTRWTYTVPAGKKAVIQSGLCSVQRNTAAAPVGLVKAYLSYTPNGGSAVEVMEAFMITNGVLDQQVAQITQLGDMAVGDAILGGDFDQGTGGTTSPGESARIFEYDA